MTTIMLVLEYVFVFLVGASVFSFLNVVIYRVPNGLDFIKGRSLCPSCKHTLSSVDMIPVFGYLFLGGKCRYCKEKISPRYMLVELFGGLASIGCTILYGISLQMVVVFSFIAILTVIAIVDLDTMEIPNGFVITVLLIGVISIFAFPQITLLERGIGIFSVALPLFIIVLIVPGGFGGGDIKLMAAGGIMLGWKLSLVAFFVAILTGGLYGIYLLVTRKKGRKEHFAFGPFLCAGMVIAFIWGEGILNWYLNLLFRS